MFSYQSRGVQQRAVTTDRNHQIGALDQLWQRRGGDAGRQPGGAGVLRRQHRQLARQQLRHQRLGTFGDPWILKLADQCASTYRLLHVWVRAFQSLAVVAWPGCDGQRAAYLT